MKAVVNREEFVNVLVKVSSVISGRNVMPITSCVLLEADDRLKLVATNLEAAVIGYCNAAVQEKGSVALDPKVLLNFLTIGGGSVAISSPLIRECAIETDSGKLTMRVSRGGKDDFPPVPKVEGVSLTLTGLKQAISDVEVGQATEDSRPVLAGIAMAPQPHGIDLVSADGFRLIVRRLSLDTDAILPRMIMIPRQTVRLLKNLVGEQTVLTIGTEAGSRYASFESNGLTVITNLTQGNYPIYNGLIPGSFAYHLTVDASRLAEAIKACGQSTDHIVRLQTVEEGMLTIRAHDDDDNAVELKLPSHGQIKIAANQRYLLDLLAPLSGEIDIMTNTPSSPFTVQSERLTHVVMPMFVQWEE
jgi:DNA polymerase-3 subunit beta